MKKEEYSIGLHLAWNREAARAAGKDDHEFIQKDYIFIGICSLLEENPTGWKKYALEPQEEESLRAELRVIKGLLGEFNLNSNELADRVRRMLGKGSYPCAGGGVITINRDKVCKFVFSRADKLASAMKVKATCLHYLAVLLNEEDSKTVEVLKEKGVNLKDLKERTIARANTIEDNKALMVIGSSGMRSLILPLKNKREMLPEKLKSVEDWLKFVLYVWHMVAFFIIGVVGIGKGLYDFLHGVWIGKSIKELIGHVIWDVTFSVLIVIVLTTFIVIFILVERFIRTQLSKPS